MAAPLLIVPLHCTDLAFPCSRLRLPLPLLPGSEAETTQPQPGPHGHVCDILSPLLRKLKQRPSLPSLRVYLPFRHFNFRSLSWTSEKKGFVTSRHTVTPWSRAPKRLSPPRLPPLPSPPSLLPPGFFFVSAFQLSDSPLPLPSLITGLISTVILFT